MGFDFSNYGSMDEPEVDKEENDITEKKPKERKPKPQPVVDEKILLDVLNKYWPEQFVQFKEEMLAKWKEEARRYEAFKKDVRAMLEVRDETLIDVWDEVWPSLQKMWKSGVFRGRLEKINRLIHDKIS